MPEQTLAHRVKAARVASSVTDVGNGLPERWSQLNEIHAAPRWLWSALVGRLLENDWTVETARKAVKAVKDAPEPPDRADAETLAAAVAEGSAKPSDVAAFAETVGATEAALAISPYRSR